MMLKAQIALDNVWEAIGALETPDFSWKSHWIAAVTGLRMVGHILYKEDSNYSNVAKEIICEHWQQWKDEDGTWFSDFIEPVRNDLLKEGKGMPFADFHSYADGEYSSLNLTMENGDDGVYLLNEAASWLQNELNEIKRKITESEEN